jgi:hypothetical protein
MCGPGFELLMLMHDDCVKCGKETEFTADMESHERRYFVEGDGDGTGQYCRECYNKK